MSIVKFGDIVKDVKNNVDRTNNPYEFYVAGDHMDSEDLNIRRRGRFATDDVGPAFVRIFEPGQILYGSRRTYLKKVAVADFSGICANTTFVLESKDPKVFDQRLLPFLMLSNAFTEWSISKSKGSTNPYVLFSDLAGFEFDLPSLDEQKVLADKLWAAYEVKQSYLKMIEATQEMVKSQFIEMFKEVSHKVTLENVVNIKDDCRKPINDSVRSTMKSGELYPYYGATGVVDYVNDYITNEQLLCIAEDCGNYRAGEESSYIIDGKAWVNNHAHVVKPKDTCSIEYLHQYLKIQNLMPYVSGTTRLKLTQKKLKEIPVILPDKERQMEFVAITKQADKSEFELRKSIDAIDKVVKSLINYISHK